MRTRPGSSVIEYVLIALVVVFAALWAATELAPAFRGFAQAAKIIGFVLSGEK